MSGADETVAVYIPSETSADWDNEPCWCVECGWDGVEDDLTFTNDGVFVCPQCSSEDTDYYYSEEAESCVFCGSDKVVGVIDIVSLNEIHEATPLDKEQVYGYCARCADVKMAEGSTGDQIISWEDGAGVSSPSMPPADIFWSESKKERIASGRKMHYAIPSEKKYPIWDKAHARMALAWSRGTKYADKVEKAVSKRFPSMAAESWAAEFAALGEPDAPYDQGYDDQQDESIGERNITTGEQSLKDRRDEADAMDKKMGRKYDDVATMDAEGWGRICGVEDKDTYEECTAPATVNLQDILMEYEVGSDPYEKMHIGEINKFYCKKHYDEMDDMWAETKGSEHHKGQGYNDELDESLGMSHKESGMKQSFKDRRDESKGTEKFDHSRAYSRVKAMDAESDSITQYILVDQSGSTQMMSLSMSSLVVTAAEAAQDDGYAVEIIGYTTKAHPWTGEPKDYQHESWGGTDVWSALEYIAEQNGGKLPTNAKYLFIVDEDMHPRYFKEFNKELNGSNTKIVFVTPSVNWRGESAEDFATHVVDGWNDFNTGIPMSGALVKNDEMIMKSWEETGSVPDNVITVQVDGVWETPSMFSAENMGLTQYVGSAGGSGDGTPVSYGGIALPESDVAAMVESSTENPMGASIGTVMGTMGAEDFSSEMASWDDSSYKDIIPNLSARVDTKKQKERKQKRGKELENDPDILYYTRRMKEYFNDMEANNPNGDSWEDYYVYTDFDSITDSDVQEYLTNVTEYSDHGSIMFINKDELSEDAISRYLVDKQVLLEYHDNQINRREAYIKYLQENYEDVTPYEVKSNWYKIRQSDDYVNWEHDTYGDDAFTLKAEEVPVVPDPSSFPQGDGRVLGQQTHQANLSPLHAEDEDVQMVKIQDPVTTGAKMALGVVALNATAIAGAALIGLALTYSARKEE